MTDRELIQDALDALTYVGDAREIYSDTIDALRARLAQREWIGLTDKEIADCLEMSIQGTCRAIEVKLREKNT